MEPESSYRLTSWEEGEVNGAQFNGGDVYWPRLNCSLHGGRVLEVSQVVWYGRVVRIHL